MDMNVFLLLLEHEKYDLNFEHIFTYSCGKCNHTIKTETQ